MFGIIIATLGIFLQPACPTKNINTLPTAEAIV